MFINDVEFILVDDEIFDNYREVTVRYSYGGFGLLRLGNTVGNDLVIDKVHRMDANNKELQYVCDVLEKNYKKLLDYHMERA